VLPKFNSAGNLPAGIHPVDWPCLLERFAETRHRQMLAAGLKAACLALRLAGCQRLYLNGSFTTAKQIPNDYDGCWDSAGVDLALLDPVLKTFANGRAAQKAKYLGELFPAGVRADRSGRTYLQFFQIDKQTGEPKGIVVLELQSVI
jgi:hypothetical protein